VRTDTCWEEQIHFFAKRFKGIYNVTQDVTLIYLAKVGLKRKEPQNMEKNMEKLTSEFFCVFKSRVFGPWRIATV